MPNVISDTMPRGPGGTAYPEEPVRAHYAPGEVTTFFEAALRLANDSLNEIALLPPEMRTLDTTLLRFETIMSDYHDRILPLTLMSYVNPDPVVAAEGSSCEERSGTFLVSVYSRRDLYDAFRTQTPRNDDELRLLSFILRQFVKNGLALPNDRLENVRAMKTRLAQLESRFSTNLNNDNTTLEFTHDELFGVPESARAPFGKGRNGSFLVTTKYPDYFAVIQNADRSETRRRMAEAFLNRQAKTNTRLLEEAIVVRAQIAKELGYDTWADYRIDGRMAGKKENVTAFLAGLKEPVKEKTTAELASLLSVKQSLFPGSESLNAWDIAYLKTRLRDRDFAIDDESVRSYFPLDVVIAGMYSRFSGILGIRFETVTGARVWACGVTLYRVVNATDNATIAYLYFDLYPREGKYGHMMIYPLISGRMLQNGTYSVPVSVIIGNVRAPDGEIPSLLSHDDVEGLFHEFGHALHFSLTRAPFASLSGLNVEWDFVETPSQALEEWVWLPEVLNAISGHYKNPDEKLPADLRDRIIAARHIDAGLTYSRMLMLSSEDMAYHTTSGPVNVTDISDALYAEMMGIRPLPGNHEPATIDHFMGGYDAGYYSYLWSKVYALNVYLRFREEGLMNVSTGTDFRSWIFEPGNMQDGMVLLKGFLKKDPVPDALYGQLGGRTPR
ncbi:M3 family metallopeptidase [Methanoregula sp.]|uniref:M3 family metallopeptidase n=1 Tax=Methanoregula sp. TaxID=2052170 RepID=UPI00356279DA